MQFLEEYTKTEEEGRVGQAKAKIKVKAAAATLPSTKDDELSRQLKYQQHQIDSLLGQVKNLVSVVKATQPSSREARTVTPSYGKGAYGTKTSGTGGDGSWKKGHPSHPGATPQSKSRNPQQGQGANKTNKQYQCWQCGEVGHQKRDSPTLKGKGLSQGWGALMALNDREYIPQMNSKMANPSGDDMVEERGPTQEEVWGKLVGRCNEGKNLYKWATSDCSVRHWQPGNACLSRFLFSQWDSNSSDHSISKY